MSTIVTTVEKETKVKNVRQNIFRQKPALIAAVVVPVVVIIVIIVVVVVVVLKNKGKIGAPTFVRWVDTGSLTPWRCPTTYQTSANAAGPWSSSTTITPNLNNQSRPQFRVSGATDASKPVYWQRRVSDVASFTTAVLQRDPTDPTLFVDANNPCEGPPLPSASGFATPTGSWPAIMYRVGLSSSGPWSDFSQPRNSWTQSNPRFTFSAFGRSTWWQQKAPDGTISEALVTQAGNVYTVTALPAPAVPSFVTMSQTTGTWLPTRYSAKRPSDAQFSAWSEEIPSPNHGPGSFPVLSFPQITADTLWKRLINGVEMAFEPIPYQGTSYQYVVDNVPQGPVAPVPQWLGMSVLTGDWLPTVYAAKRSGDADYSGFSVVVEAEEGSFPILHFEGADSHTTWIRRYNGQTSVVLLEADGDDWIDTTPQTIPEPPVPFFIKMNAPLYGSWEPTEYAARRTDDPVFSGWSAVVDEEEGSFPEIGFQGIDQNTLWRRRINGVVEDISPEFHGSYVIDRKPQFDVPLFEGMSVLTGDWLPTFYAAKRSTDAAFSEWSAPVRGPGSFPMLSFPGANSSTEWKRRINGVEEAIHPTPSGTPGLYTDTLAQDAGPDPPPGNLRVTSTNNRFYIRRSDGTLFTGLIAPGDYTLADLFTAIPLAMGFYGMRFTYENGRVSFGFGPSNWLNWGFRVATMTNTSLTPNITTQNTINTLLGFKLQSLDPEDVYAYPTSGFQMAPAPPDFISFN